MSANATLTLEKTETFTNLSQNRDLNLKDRCDRCNAAAYWRFWRTDLPAELLFCGHHGNSYQAALIGQGFDFDDQSIKLRKNTKPMSGSNMAD